MSNINAHKKVFVAMSGGVDSSVSALLLKQDGYDITGVYFTPWKPENGKAFCDWEQDRHDAMRVATQLGINFETWDLSEKYGKEVTQYMIDTYNQGRTPNPDVLCNEKIKFGIFLDEALKKGADFIATGHYAKIQHNDNISYLKKARDENKDQTYFLCRLKQAQLRKSLFPLGDLLKSEVREIAKKNNLVNHAKKDSQGVCFIGMLDMKDFLHEYIEPQKGEVRLLENDEVIGTHDGTMYYTIGQRHGLDLKKDGGPYYVISKDNNNNIIYVSTDENKLDKFEIIAQDQTWTNVEPEMPFGCDIKIRYRGEYISATVSKAGDNLKITTQTPMKSPASGQYVVFYDKDIVLGCGVIS